MLRRIILKQIRTNNHTGVFMKSLLLALMFLPAVSFAAPTGHQICRDANKKFEFVFGTYALSGDDGTLKISGQEFLVSAQPGEGYGDLTQKIEVFCLCEAPKGPKVGDVKWDVTSGDASNPASIHMTIKRLVSGKEKVTNIDMACEVLDYKPGNEQD